jgi:hypothetical protein
MSKNTIYDCPRRIAMSRIDNTYVITVHVPNSKFEFVDLNLDIPTDKFDDKKKRIFSCIQQHQANLKTHPILGLSRTKLHSVDDILAKINDYTAKTRSSRAPDPYDALDYIVRNVKKYEQYYKNFAEQIVQETEALSESIMEQEKAAELLEDALKIEEELAAALGESATVDVGVQATFAEEWLLWLAANLEAILAGIGGIEVVLVVVGIGALGKWALENTNGKLPQYGVPSGGNSGGGNTGGIVVADNGTGGSGSGSGSTGSGTTNDAYDNTGSGSGSDVGGNPTGAEKPDKEDKPNFIDVILKITDSLLDLIGYGDDGPMDNPEGDSGIPSWLPGDPIVIPIGNGGGSINAPTNPLDGNNPITGDDGLGGGFVVPINGGGGSIAPSGGDTGNNPTGSSGTDVGPDLPANITGGDINGGPIPLDPEDWYRQLFKSTRMTVYSKNKKEMTDMANCIANSVVIANHLFLHKQYSKNDKIAEAARGTVLEWAVCLRNAFCHEIAKLHFKQMSIKNDNVYTIMNNENLLNTAFNSANNIVMIPDTDFQPNTVNYNSGENECKYGHHTMSSIVHKYLNSAITYGMICGFSFYYYKHIMNVLKLLYNSCKK